MPIGLIVMNWDERKGAQIITKYPAEVELSEKALMQIYSAHEYDSEPGTVSLAIGGMNALSYFSGAEKAYYIILLLMAEEEPDLYEDGLVDASRELILRNEEITFKTLVPMLFQRISTYPSYKPEQKLASIFADKLKRTILLRLEEEGVIFKSEMHVWLKDIERAVSLDTETLVSSLIKDGLAKEVSIKAAPSALIFLIRDIFVARRPPTVLIREEAEDHGMPPSFKDQYLQEVQTFFKGYKPTLEDNIKLAELLIDQQFYVGLELLRNYVVSREDLEKLKKKGLDDVDALLKKFWDNKLITVLRDKAGKELYALIADITFERSFPLYLLNIIRKNYAEKSKSNPVLLEHLNILKDVFLEERAQLKRNIRAKD